MAISGIKYFCSMALLLMLGSAAPAHGALGCDLDGDGDCDTDDLRILYDDIGDFGGPSDLNGDGLVNNEDIDEWLLLAGSENGLIYVRGDIELDGSVAGNDFTRLAANFGQSGLPGAYWDEGNFNGNRGGDFSVVGDDFTILAANFGHVSVSAVPEPSSLGMLICTVLIGLGTLRPRR